MRLEYETWNESFKFWPISISLRVEIGEEVEEEWRGEECENEKLELLEITPSMLYISQFDYKILGIVIFLGVSFLHSALNLFFFSS